VRAGDKGVVIHPEKFFSVKEYEKWCLSMKSM